MWWAEAERQTAGARCCRRSCLARVAGAPANIVSRLQRHCELCLRILYRLKQRHNKSTADAESANMGTGGLARCICHGQARRLLWQAERGPISKAGPILRHKMVRVFSSTRSEWCMVQCHHRRIQRCWRVLFPALCEAWPRLAGGVEVIGRPRTDSCTVSRALFLVCFPGRVCTPVRTRNIHDRAVSHQARTDRRHV